jgi:c(7)-type cytochrome triheme protein
VPVDDASTVPGGGRSWWGLWLGLCVLTVAAPVLAAAFPSSLRIPRKDAGHATSIPLALFSHRTHGSLGCFACHPSVFQQAPLGFTHEEMSRGRFCGRCHDGRVAFAITGRLCGDCHAPAR